MARPVVEMGRASRFVTVASICVVIAALYFGKPILMPLALSTLFVFVLAPVVSWLERMHVHRGIASTLIVGLAMAVFLGIGYVVIQQFEQVVSELPQYKADIQSKLSRLRGSMSPIKRISGELGQIATSGPTSKPAAELPSSMLSPTPPGTSAEQPPSTEPVKDASEQNPLPVRVVSRSNSAYTEASQWAMSVLDPLVTAGVVVGYVIFILIAREDLRDRLLRLFGHGRLNVTTQAIDEATRRITRYLVAESLVNVAYGTFVGISLWAIGRIWGEGGHGFPNVLLWALICTLLRFVPYIGVWVAMVLPVAVSFALFKGNAVFIATVVMFVVLEVGVSQFVEPFLYGSTTGMSPLAVLIAAVFWALLWGPIGLLLSTPLTVCLVVLGKYVPQLEFLNILLGDEPVLSPPVRFYQRLIASDPEEATKVALDDLKSSSLEHTFNEVLLPALAMAERDERQEQLDEQHYDFVLQRVRELVDELVDASTVQRAKGEGKDEHEPQAPESPAAKRTNLPEGCTVNVLCLPARDEADELTARMLSELLRERGYCATALGSDALVAEMVDNATKEKPDLICVCALPPAAITHARYLLKRLSNRLPKARTVVCLWLHSRDLGEARERLSVPEEVNVVSDLPEAQHAIDQLSQHFVARASADAPAAQTT